MNRSASEERVGWVSMPNSHRGTLQLLLGCFFTILLSTWNAIHLNVPADGDTSWTVFCRKLKWMAVAIVCPEYVTVMAVTEWWDAQFLRREIQELCGAQVSGLSVPIRAVDKPTDTKAVAGQTLFYDPELLRCHGRLCTSPF
jgi:hypothetical protein